MTGYVILAVICVFAFSCLFSFVAGLKHGKKQAAVEHAEDQYRRTQNEKEYRKTESDIKQEVFNEAEEKKANLSGGTTGRGRFNDINNSLRNNTKR